MFGQVVYVIRQATRMGEDMNARKPGLLAFAAISAAAVVLLGGCFTSTDPPAQVTSVTAAANTLSTLTVSWDIVADDATPPEDMTYEVHWSTVSGQSAEEFTAMTTVTGETSTVIDGIPGYTPVYFAVRAINGSGLAGVPSGEVPASTTATQGFVDGNDAVIDVLGSNYTATFLEAVAIGSDIYITWDDATGGGLALNGAVLTSSAAEFVSIKGEDLNYRTTTGGNDLFIAGAEFSPLNTYRYDPAPVDDWTDVTGTVASGDTDTAVALATIDGAVHLARLSDDGANQQAEVFAFDGSDWSALAGGPVFTGTTPVWNTDPPLLAGANGETFLEGEQSSGVIQVFRHDGSNWTDISSADWTASTETADLVMMGTTVYLVAIDTLELQVWEYSGSGSSWTKVVADGRYDASEAVQAATAAALNGTLYVAWNETAGASVYRTRLGAYSASAESPTWQVIDGTGPEGLNTDPVTYSTREPTILAHNNSVKVFFTEDSGSATVALIRAYSYE